MKPTETKRQSSLMVYFCGREDCLPGHSFGPAVRPHYLIHVILDGKGIYKYKGHTYHLKKGDAFLISPMESTYYQADLQTPWHYAWVGFDGYTCPELLSKTVFDNSCVFLNPHPENAAQMAECMRNLLDCSAELPENPVKTAGYLLILLSHMAKKNDESGLACSTSYFQKAKEYILNNYAYPIRISDIARHVGIDRTYLYRIFMEHANLSPKQYLLRHRLRIATEMLCSSDYTITEIALSCGFNDPAAFSNHFRQIIGCSPSSFRKSIQEENK